ncbi:ThuA domain-containing protein [Algisphaera agarilytica]|uniref:Type 1 glutamine amidotransferase n=1 Tax=Algisphaera agarilytica TaxID=1385975 RepID=A0A7X0H5E2_9BACT|nr:ThuA domain-containing protein [Algisphaera agarilytica]MBB6429463.1 type 1 glutamine amidotransferase [Algisphaera agarilytica]
MSDSPIRLAVIIGDHPFDVPAFYDMLRSMPDVDPYVQNLEDFTADFGKVAETYDVVLFYNFHQNDPAKELPWFKRDIFEGLEKLGRPGQGVFLLHHGCVAFKQWQVWTELSGWPQRGLIPHHDETVNTFVADRDHPVTAGVDDWTMTDETYEMPDVKEADGNHILLTTDHPKSCKPLAWTRTFGESDVLCYLAGHDGEALGHTNVRRIIHQGIKWLAGRSG